MALSAAAWLAERNPAIDAIATQTSSRRRRFEKVSYPRIFSVVCKPLERFRPA
jgi:hypothetical protein